MGATKTLIATIATTLALAGVARAEMPQNLSAPEVTGRAAIGWGVVGHNGTWLYDGATARVYKVRAVDVGYQFRVIVTTTKYDCGAHNTETGQIECRWVMRAAASPQTEVVPKPKVKAKPKPGRGPRG